MADRFLKFEIKNLRFCWRQKRRARLLPGAVAIWAALALPGSAAPLTLDTAGMPVSDVVSALRRAYQLPVLIGVARTPTEEDAAVERERTRLRALMAEFGYLDAEIAVERSDAGTVLRPVLGRRYVVGSVELKGVRQSELKPNVVTDLAAIVRAFVGKPATSQGAETFGRRVLDSVGKEDFAFARLRTVRWTRMEDGMATAAIDLDMGPRSSFGGVTFSGLRRLEAKDLASLVPFRAGDRYERVQMERFRDNLRTLKTVKSFNINLDKAKDGALAIDVRMREAPADLSALRDSSPFGLSSGIAALSALALAQIVGMAGIASGRLRPLVWGSAVFVLTFAVAVAPRLVSFLS